MIDLAVLAVAGLLRADLPRLPDLPRLFVSMPQLAAPGPASYDQDSKSVSTWRDGTARTLEPAPLAIASAFFELGRPVVARCVRLNNPWCIKRARWPGEIGGDEEGHTAFASTEAGADAAANLLRAYYITHGRKSALDIVRRWAPAECRISLGGTSISIALGGLAGTLRGRYLASTGGRRAGAPAAPPTVKTTRKGVAIKAPRGGRVRVSIVPMPAMPSYRVPSLMSGGGERARPAAPVARAQPAPKRNAASAPRPARAAPAAPARSRPGGTSPVKLAGIPAATPSYCGSEEGRIQAYAGAIARALGVQPGSDLKLFDASGQPTINLLPVMVAMSAVELGYLHASAPLAEGAVERLKAKLALEAAREAPPSEQNHRMDTGTP